MHSSIKGSLWAVFLAGSGLSFASLVAPPVMEGKGPDTPQLQTPQPMVAAPATEGLTPPSTTDTAPAFAPAPTVPDVTVAETEIEVDTTTPAPPAPEVAEVAPAEIEETADAAEEEAATVVAEAETADQTMEQAETPTDPAGTLMVEDTPDEAEETAAPAEVVVAAPAPVTEVPVEDSPVAAADETAEADTMTADAPTDDTAAAEADTTQDTQAPLVSTTQPEAAAAPLIVQAPVTADTPDPEEEIAAEEETAPVATEDAVVADAPAIATPAPETTEGTALDVPTAQASDTTETSTPPSQIRINRPGAEESSPAGQEAEVLADEALAEDLPALQAHAAIFEDTRTTPIVAVILIDDGQMPDAASAFADLGFTPTVALNALAGDAAEKMQSYRAAGAEIALETGLPPMAQPTDLEVAFEAAFGILPEAALVFADASDMLLSDRDLTAQAMAILKAEGHGFVAVQRGLGSAIREAEDAGVPAATVEREIDDGTTDEGAILRALDQAAFRARQSGEAVLLGRLQPATLNALRDWAADLDPDQLQIAPVSAVLLRQSD